MFWEVWFSSWLLHSSLDQVVQIPGGNIACVLLGKTLYSNSAPGVQMGTSKHNSGGNSALA